MNEVLNRQVSLWMERGTLHDPYGEFFVQCSVADGGGGAVLEWNAHRIDVAMVPAHFSVSDARSILFVGQCAAYLGADTAAVADQSMATISLDELRGAVVRSRLAQRASHPDE